VREAITTSHGLAIVREDRWHWPFAPGSDYL